jgi:L-glyceraldehyde 3-phosphate reductase
MQHEPAANRYETMTYNRCGRSGVKIPAISLGLWHNFGAASSLQENLDLLATAFDLGITHFDLANNYGPPPGSAEERFGQILAANFRPWRDEMFISTKAGYYMWPGPYGEWGSRKYLHASLDQSLRRMHLADVVRQGKALYVGISNYPAEQARLAARMLRDLGTPCLLHQPRYNLFERGVETGLLDVAAEEGFGIICFSPLAQGVLSGKYTTAIPPDSRVGRGSSFLTKERLSPERITKAARLEPIAKARGQTLAQLALAWVLRDKRMTSALIGASRPQQVRENVDALQKRAFTAEELAAIEAVLAAP